MPDDNNYYIKWFKRNELYLSSRFLIKFNNENWKDLSFEKYDEHIVWEIISKMLEYDCNEGNINQVHIVPEFKDNMQYFGQWCCFVDSNLADSTFSNDAKYDVKTYIPLGHLIDDIHTNKFIISNSSANKLVDLFEHSPEELVSRKIDPERIQTVMKNYTRTINHYKWIRNFQNNFTWKNESDGNLKFIQLQMKDIYINELTTEALDNIRQLCVDTEYETFKNTQPFKNESTSYIYIIDAVVMATVTIFYKLHHTFHHEFVMPPEFSKNEDAENDEPRKHSSEELEDIPVAFKFKTFRVDGEGHIMPTAKIRVELSMTEEDIEAFHNKNMAQFIFEDDQDPTEVTETEPETFLIDDDQPAPPKYRRPVIIDLTNMGQDKMKAEINDSTEE